MGYKIIKNAIEQFPHVTTRPMFGYECFSVNGRFFAGFDKKNKEKMIVRLKAVEQRALTNEGIKPFSHGAKAGWIEINTKSVKDGNVLKWIKEGYAHAIQLSK
ncbi:MAG: TfoX/Sxy family protein [Nitrososphaerales archaeon]